MQRTIGTLIIAWSLLACGCCTTPNGGQPGNGGGGGNDPPEPVVETYTRSVADAPGMGLTVDQSRTYTVNIGRTFDPDSIRAIVIWVDTGGLSFHQYACDAGVADSCDDALEILAVRRWDRARGSGQSNSVAGEIDVGEQQYFNSSTNAAYFDAAKRAVADGAFEVAVHPFARDNFRLARVDVVVTYEVLP